MANVKLAEYCATCKSHYHCGRPCPRAPTPPAVSAPAEPPPARVTSFVTPQSFVTPPHRRGRPPIGALAMSGAERTRRWRAARRTTHERTIAS